MRSATHLVVEKCNSPGGGEVQLTWNGGKILFMERRIFRRFWIIIAATAGLVALFLVGWLISTRVSEAALFEGYNQQQSLVLKGTAAGIEGLFDDLSAGLSSLGSLASVQFGDTEAAREALVRKRAELDPLGVAEIGLLDAGGVAVAFAIEHELEGVDYSWRSFFKISKAAVEAGDPTPVVIEMQPLESGDMGFRIAVPVADVQTEAFKGLILGELTLDTLIERHLAPFQPPGGGQIFLVDNDFDLLWSSDRDQGKGSLLGSGRSDFSEMVAQMETWDVGEAAGGAYAYRNPGWRRETRLVAFAPVRVGDTVLAVAIRTPGGVARQTALSTSRSQSLVFTLSLVTLLVGVLVGTLVLRRETRRRLALEAALRQSETEQAILAERNRLASDLHDSVTQGLYGITLHAGAALGQLEAGESKRAGEYLHEIKGAGKEALAEMRLLIFELRPPVLAEGGLGVALEARLYAVEKRAGLKVIFSNELGHELPKAVETSLYRIAQEGLNNLLKHAQAQKVQVHLRGDDDGVTLEIADDGVGFDPEVGRQSGGFGLVGMAARAEELGAELVIESHPGEGTHLYVRLKGEFT